VDLKPRAGRLSRERDLFKIKKEKVKKKEW